MGGRNEPANGSRVARRHRIDHDHGLYDLRGRGRRTAAAEFGAWPGSRPRLALQRNALKLADRREVHRGKRSLPRRVLHERSLRAGLGCRPRRLPPPIGGDRAFKLVSARSPGMAVMSSPHRVPATVHYAHYSRSFVAEVDSDPLRTTYTSRGAPPRAMYASTDRNVPALQRQSLEESALGLARDNKH